MICYFYFRRWHSWLFTQPFTNQNKNQYFVLDFQTNSTVYRTVCFSPEKHAALKRKFECSSPVKVNKYNLKKNDKTGEEELIWNTRTKIEEPQESEMEIDLQPKQKQ